ncbi:hypothetical protein [Cellulophaga sp. L1A9]|uniref:hypothetical protein n=1 Tax=Cellulophaga sp. L1A9 TaxID=2686362 RepID=UPI00131DCA77|nr:hypothetical protein [Cellulophaga sp. L1A9]
MKDEIFYIIIKNRYYIHDYNNYHIERIFSKNDVLKAIDEILEQMGYDDFIDHYNSYIITNDRELLMKYIFTLTVSDFELLCGSNDYKIEETRISKYYLRSFNEEVLFYFRKVKNKEIVSANEETVCTSFERFGNGEFHTLTGTGYGDVASYYEGWVMNKNFEYFKTPAHYSNLENSNTIFCLKNIKKANLEEINELLNFDILKGCQNINLWEQRDGGLLRYFDKNSNKRLYIAQHILDALIIDINAVLRIETTIDRDQIIAYYVNGIFNESTKLRRTTNYENRNSDYPIKYIRKPEDDDLLFT